MPRHSYVRCAFIILPMISLLMDSAVVSAAPAKAERPSQNEKIVTETEKVSKTKQPIKFHRSIKEAIAANKDNKPIVIQFTASWCGACRSMESSTLNSTSVREVSGDYIWAKIDIDQHRDLASLYRVGTIPHTTVLNTERQLIVTKVGFMGSSRFIQFLEQSVDSINETAAASTDKNGKEEY